MTIEFVSFSKIPRLQKDIIITEKVDGTNSQVYIADVSPEDAKTMRANGNIYEARDSLPNGGSRILMAGSRNRWLSPSADNFGFCKWAFDNAEELLNLGPGRHYGEWWGKGIQRGYGVDTKQFSLFHTHRIQKLPSIVSVVPVLYSGAWSDTVVNETLNELVHSGSYISPGFMNPEGIVLYHTAANQLFKIPIDPNHKGT